MEVLREIRQRPGWQAVPVVMLTSSADTPDVTKAVLLGANGYLVKPVRPEDFHARTREAGLTWALVSPGGGETMATEGVQDDGLAGGRRRNSRRDGRRTAR